ncbi:cyclase family protein [Actinomadura sp. 7K507]|uniref:cyclase family protein n=1 Tax=Actinomadura sp. 7K507 TaxID=2530365 RepID=UPI00104B2FEF|nr:cyclase family protein [Actinomadura sp. 7K507]TDC94569.1 cyclase family protein [Actinomadura sp. 7K507]
MNTTPNIATVRALGDKYGNWGKWGDDDEFGTLNHIKPEDVVKAAGLVRTGRIAEMGLPIDDQGPQSGGGGLGRFNPIHLMIRDGGDVAAGTMVRDFYGGQDRHMRGTDDILIMPLQSGTQWDALAHIFFEGKMYNGFTADQVGSKGALKNDITGGCSRMIGRGVLLDVPAAKGVRWLPSGYAVTSADLEECERRQGVSVGRGDFVFVRTGQMAEVRDRGSWGDYAGGAAPGLGLDAVPWVGDRKIAALATDTWGMEVRPNETPDTNQPLHIVFLVYMGLWVGEIFDLEPLAQACSEEGRWEFMFSGPPLRITRAVGSPLAPVAVF